MKLRRYSDMKTVPSQISSDLSQITRCITNITPIIKPIMPKKLHHS